MARKRRLIEAGYCYHVMVRGNGGQEIFKDDADRSRFCLLLQYAKEKHALNIHGFCLMGNHVHLVVQPRTSDLSSGMHSLTFRYAQHFNMKHDRRGYLYQGRYKSIMVQSGIYLLRLLRYVHLNPVRAGIVRHPEEFAWSSHLAYLGSKEYVWLNRSLVLDAFGEEKGVENLLRYTQMDDNVIRDETLEIRKAVRLGVYGDPEFIEEWRPKLSEDWTEESLHKVSPASIAELVCCHLDITLEEIRSENRSKQLVEARALMASLNQKLKAGSMADLGRCIARDPTSLARLAKKCETDPPLKKLSDDLICSLKYEK